MNKFVLSFSLLALFASTMPVNAASPVTEVSGTLDFTLDATGVCSAAPATMYVTEDFISRTWPDGHIEYRLTFSSVDKLDASGKVLGRGRSTDHFAGSVDGALNTIEHVEFTCRGNGATFVYVCGIRLEPDGQVTSRGPCRVQ
jgi:hypothetical protein